MTSHTQGPTAHEPGTIIAGRYRLVGLLGRGGFAEVHRAIDLELRQEVALKLLHHSRSTSEGGVRRFQREAQLVRQLEHPNTVRPLDFGQAQPEGLPFIAWELLRGRSLEKLLDEVGPLPPARMLHIAVQVLGSLEEAHRLGVVHRDIKPDNIFLIDVGGDRDFVKVLDFGLAKPVGTLGLSFDKLTEKDEIIGTPSYMAPEQVGTEQTITPATDLYALGLVLAELLTGRVVVTGRTPVRIMLSQASAEPVPLPGAVVSSPFGPVIERATRKATVERYQGAREMAADLREAFRRIDPTWQHLLLPGVTCGRLSSHTVVSLADLGPAGKAVAEPLDSTRPTLPAELDDEGAPAPVTAPACQEAAPRQGRGCPTALALALALAALAVLGAVAFVIFAT